MLAGIPDKRVTQSLHITAPLASGGLWILSARGKRNNSPNRQIYALDGSRLEIAPGEIFGLLGPNGAGSQRPSESSPPACARQMAEPGLASLMCGLTSRVKRLMVSCNSVRP